MKSNGRGMAASDPSAKDRQIEVRRRSGSVTASISLILLPAILAISTVRSRPRGATTTPAEAGCFGRFSTLVNLGLRPAKVDETRQWMTFGPGC